MRNILVDIIGVIVVLGVVGFISIFTIPVEAQGILYHEDVFKIYGDSFTINVTYIFKNPDPRVQENNTITYIIRPYNSTHLNVSSAIVYYVYYFYYKPQVRRIGRSDWWLMRYDPNGYIVMWYNGSTIPTFSRETYNCSCGLVDTEISRIMLAQFSNMIDVVERYSGSVREVDDMTCSCSNDGNIAIMGGFAEDVGRYWFVIAYILIIMATAVGIGYFIEKKIIIKKLKRHK